MIQEYRFKHHKNIIASVGYPWSIKALIMVKKGRIVICSVPVETITKSKSWVKVKNK